jgi:hypothetical protein
MILELFLPKKNGEKFVVLNQTVAINAEKL